MFDLEDFSVFYFRHNTNGLFVKFDNYFQCLGPSYSPYGERFPLSLNIVYDTGKKWSITCAKNG